MIADITHHAAAAQPIDYHRLILCLEQVEGGSRNSAGGKLCWTKAAWKEESKTPFSFAQQDPASHLYAWRRLVRLGAVLRECDIAVTPYSLACLWHLGLDGTLKLLRSGVASDYATRVTTLYFCQ